MTSVSEMNTYDKQPESVATVEEKGAPQQPPELTFPEGGVVAWLNVCGSFLVAFCTLGFVQSFGVFQDYYTRNFLSDRSPSDISWIGSLDISLAFILSIIAGKLFDDGYFRILLLGSSLLLVYSTFMLSLTKPQHYYQVFLSQGLGQGIAMGMMFLPSISLSAHYFQARRAAVLGIAISGASIAGVVLPIMLNHLFNGHVGFHWGVRVLGFMTLGMLAYANIVMKQRLPERRAPSKQQTQQLLKKMVTDVPFIIFNIGVVLVYWGLYFPVFYLQLFAVLHGVDSTLAFYSLPILNAASSIGRIIPNMLADRYGSMNCNIPATALSGALTFAMFGAKTSAGLVVFAILYGFTSGASLSLSLSSAAHFADDIHEIGSRTGFAMFCLSFPLLTGNPIAGSLLRAPQYEWSRPIIFCGVVILVGSAFLLFSRNLLAKRRGTWKV